MVVACLKEYDLSRLTAGSFKTPFKVGHRIVMGMLIFRSLHAHEKFC